MKIQISDVERGVFDGQLFWVCQFYYDSAVKSKAVAHTKPAQAKVLNGQLWILNKKGETRKSFRPYSFSNVVITDNEMECNSEYNKMVEEVKNMHRDYIDTIKAKISDFDKLKK